MLTKITHGGEVENVNEILFRTRFGYMFSDLVTHSDALLPVAERTQEALLQLGHAMGDPGTDPALDSNIPAVFTYVGQFIDHDITARTDRDSNFNRIAGNDGRPIPIAPLDPAAVVENLFNGRRPQLDLDSLYGDGPGILHNPALAATTEAEALYETDKKLKIQPVGSCGFDLPRVGRRALIADMRNDENLNVSQLHASFIALHNTIVDNLASGHTDERAYIKAREMVRWAYQYAVLSDYLSRICDSNVVRDVMRNGPRFFGPGTGGSDLYMPLEFSVAAFRFGHSMVRKAYTVQATTTLSVTDVLGVNTVPDPQKNHKTVDLLTTTGGAHHLKPDHLVHWSNLAQFSGGAAPQMARRIDPLLSVGLFDLSFEEAPFNSMIRHLAKRNLLRGYRLSIPTGQAAAGAMGIHPLSEAELLSGETQAIRDALGHGRFQARTPLWYYLLREAQVQKDGNSLGAVGSRLVAETLIGFLKHDPNAFLNNRHHGRVKGGGIKLPGIPTPVATFADLIDYAGMPK